MVSALVILQTSTSFVQSLHEPSNQNHQQAQKSSKKSLFPPGKGPEACKNTCPALAKCQTLMEKCLLCPLPGWKLTACPSPRRAV